MHESISFEQIPFGSDDFADNPESRCPCVLLLDTSGSMGGRPIEELNNGIQTLKNELLQDTLASKRVEIAVITFGPVALESDFETVANFYPRNLLAGGDTPIGNAITLGIDLITNRKKIYRENGIGYYKPWIILITDGEPTDDWSLASKMIHAGEQENKFAFFAIGVEDARMDVLEKLSYRSPIKLKGLLFREFFLWLSSSMKMVSSKNPGEQTKLLPPTGWADL